MHSETLLEQLARFDTLTEQEQAGCLYWLRQFPDILLRLDHPPQQVVLAAVSSRGTLLQHVKNQTPEICWAAICNAPEAIKFVVDQSVDLEVESVSRMPATLAAIEHPADATVYVALALDPTALRNLQIQEGRFCEFAVRRNPAALEFVREKTPALVKMAIERNPMMLEFVPPEFQSCAICQRAVEHDPLAARYIHDEELKTQMLYHLTSGKLDQSRIEMLIRNDPDYFINLWDLDHRFWNEALLDLALTHHGESLMSELWEIAEPLPEALLLKTLSRDGTLLRYVVEDNLTLPVCLAATSQTPEALEFVPEIFFEQCLQHSLDQD